MILIVSVEGNTLRIACLVLEQHCSPRSDLYLYLKPDLEDAIALISKKLARLWVKRETHSLSSWSTAESRKKQNKRNFIFRLGLKSMFCSFWKGSKTRSKTSIFYSYRTLFFCLFSCMCFFFCIRSYPLFTSFPCLHLSLLQYIAISKSVCCYTHTHTKIITQNIFPTQFDS